MRNKMFSAVMCLAISLLAWPALAETTASSGIGDQYLMAVADYFEVSYEAALSQTSTFAPEEIPVLFYMAQCANVPVARVIELKGKDQSWAETASRLELNAAHFHVIVTGEIKSATFAPIFEKYRVTPDQNWRKLVLSDEEIVSLVNLRVMYSQYDYSAYEVMAFRDTNKSWANVNKLVAEAKSEYLKNEMAKQD